MATLVLKDAKLWIGQYNVSGDHNAVSINWTIDTVDATTFGQNSRVYRPGLHQVSLDLEGYADYGAGLIDAILESQLGAERITTVSPDGGDAGEVAYLTKDLIASLSKFGSIGDMDGFRVTAQGVGSLARGLILEDGQTTRDTTFDGTARQVGAVASGKRLYGALHVISASGSSPTLDVVVESDAADDFTGSETSRLTFDQQTDVGSDWQFLAGPITDTWYRIAATIGGTSPEFDFVVAVGIA